MITSSKDTARIASACSGVAAGHVVRFARRVLDPRRSRLAGTSEVTTPDQGARSLVLTEAEPRQILLVDALHALHELHLSLLRSIPAIVESLGSCADLYLNRESTFALVILVLHPRSKETAEAAHFVRNRWSGARILLLESEAVLIDDWLYDDRVDPQSHPATLCEAAIRLMTKKKHWIPA